MNKLLAAIPVLVLGAGLPATPQHQAPPHYSQNSSDHAQVAGNWQLSVDTPHGKMGGVLRIRQEGAKLSGTCQIEGHETAQVTGVINGKNVSLNVSFQERETTVKFEGSVDGEKMTGSTEFGAWTASRAKADL